MFLVTTIWRGSLHIDPMRLVKTEAEATAYKKSISNYDEVRVYEVFQDKPPKLRKDL